MNDNIILFYNTIKQIINKLPNKCLNGPDRISNFYYRNYEILFVYH